MEFDVIEGNGKVRSLVIKNICPYCGKRTARKLGDAVLGRFASRAVEEGDLICYYCTNPDCEGVNYYVRKTALEEFAN